MRMSLVVLLSLVILIPLADAQNPQLQWTFDGPTQSPNFPGLASPIVVVSLTDDNGDCLIDEHDFPDILVCAFSFTTFSGAILAIDGSSGILLFTIPSLLPLDPGPVIPASITNDAGITGVGTSPTRGKP